jgi:colanic acid/amylovoran biosynthesis glycosyltransferase
VPDRIAYLVSQYPALSHVFVEREIEGLRALGASIETFSVRPPAAGSLMSKAMQLEASRTTVLLSSERAVLRASARLVRTNPHAGVRGVVAALRNGPAFARFKLWQLFYLGEAARLYDLLSRTGIRHVHVHFSNNSADIARLVVAIGRAVEGRNAGWRWSMTVHGPTEFERVEATDLAAKVEDASAVACISDFTRSQLMRLTPTEVWPRLHVVRMSVDVQRYAPPVPDRHHLDPAMRVLNVGRLVPEKGGPVLIDAVRHLRSIGVDVAVRMIGAGPLQRELQTRVHDAGLTDIVSMLGAVGQDDLPEHYEWADVFVLPSFQEGLPVVLMEAMATELPVVTTAIAGIPELVGDGVTGRVLAPGRPDLLAEALRDLRDEPSLRTAWGRAGRAKVMAEFATEVAARSQYEFLRGVVE